MVNCRLTSMKLMNRRCHSLFKALDLFAPCSATLVNQNKLCLFCKCLPGNIDVAHEFALSSLCSLTIPPAVCAGYLKSNHRLPFCLSKLSSLVMASYLRSRLSGKQEMLLIAGQLCTLQERMAGLKEKKIRMGHWQCSAMFFTVVISAWTRGNEILPEYKFLMVAAKCFKTM